MAVSIKRHLLTGFIPVLLGTMVFAGCSWLPWSKDKDTEPYSDAETIYIEDLERGKGTKGQVQSKKRAQRPAPHEEKEQAFPEIKGKEGPQRGETAPAFTAPADLSFSPVRGLRRKICVVNFEDRTGPHKEKYGELAALKLLKELENTQRAVLVDKEVVREALVKEGIEPEGLLEPHAMKEAHQILGIQAFIAGSISDLQVKSSSPVGDEGIKSSMASVRIELRLLDGPTANLLRTFIGKNPSFTAVETGLHSDHRSVLKAIDYGIGRVIDGLLRYLDFLEWSSTVVKVQDGKVFINAGRLTGLQVGNILDVYEPGHEVINPVTKFSLGWTTGERKGSVIVTRLFGVDGSVAEPVNGVGFTVNDVVKVSQK